MQHAAKVFDALPAEQETPTNSNPRMTLFQALTPQFDKRTYIALAAQLQIPENCDSARAKQTCLFCRA
jgi:hypothetical protein